MPLTTSVGTYSISEANQELGNPFVYGATREIQKRAFNDDRYSSLDPGDEHPHLIVRSLFPSVDDLCALSVTFPRESPESSVFAQPFSLSVCFFCQPSALLRSGLMNTEPLCLEAHYSPATITIYAINSKSISQVGIRLKVSCAARKESRSRAPCYEHIRSSLHDLRASLFVHFSHMRHP